MLTISNSTIRMIDGLYSLNDLHKASGNNKKHQPTFFLRNQEIIELIKEIKHSSNLQSAEVINRINGGLGRGTYVCKELAYRYAMRINTAYSLPKANKQRFILKHTFFFIVWVTVIGCLILFEQCTPVNAKTFATDYSSGYYIDLSKITSGQASRYLLAFSVPDNSPASQAVSIPSSTAPKAQLSATREHSLISIANYLLTDYDGLTLQNKIAERRICGAASSDAESKTRHPISLLDSVALTHKSLGGSYHG